MTNLEIYKSIPTYPDSVKVGKERTLAADAPLCEDEHGNISFVSSDLRKKWMNAMYAKEQRIRDGKKRYTDKDD